MLKSGWGLIHLLIHFKHFAKTKMSQTDFMLKLGNLAEILTIMAIYGFQFSNFSIFPVNFYEWH